MGAYDWRTEESKAVRCPRCREPEAFCVCQDEPYLAQFEEEEREPNPDAPWMGDD